MMKNSSTHTRTALKDFVLAGMVIPKGTEMQVQDLQGYPRKWEIEVKLAENCTVRSSTDKEGFNRYAA